MAEVWREWQDAKTGLPQEPITPGIEEEIAGTGATSGIRKTQREIR